MKLLFIFYFIISCSKVGTDEVSQFQKDELNIAGDISFEEFRKNILLPNNCIGCHGNFSTLQGLSGVIIAGDPESSSLYLQVKQGLMPKNGIPLSENNLEYTRQFIIGLKGSGNQNPDPPSNDLNFTNFQISNT